MGYIIRLSIKNRVICVKDSKSGDMYPAALKIPLICRTARSRFPLIVMGLGKAAFKRCFNSFSARSIALLLRYNLPRIIASSTFCAFLAHYVARESKSDTHQNNSAQNAEIMKFVVPFLAVRDI